MTTERAAWRDATHNGQLTGTAARRAKVRDRCPGCGGTADAWLGKGVVETGGNEFHDGGTYDSMACAYCGYVLVFARRTGDIHGKGEAPA